MMTLPKENRRGLVVDGINTFDDLELVMAERDMPPAPVKSYVVDIPGGNGEIDLTEAFLGDAAYGNREFTFAFELLSERRDIEAVRDQFVRMFHGKRKEFSLTFDPGYTYTGRFAVESTKTNGRIQRFVVKVDADPFKSKGLKTEMFNVSDGIVAHLASGRKMVKPTFEFSGDTIVVFEGRRYVMPAGTYTIEDLYFKEGTNEITFVKGGITSHLTWGEAAKNTWAEFKTRPLYEWYKGITKYYVSRIVLTAVETPITGTISFTATDANGGTFTQTLDLGDLQIRAANGEADTITIFDGVAHVRKIIGSDGSVLLLPRSYTFEFPMLFSNDAEIVGLTHDTPASVTYETAEMNVEKVIREALWSEYMEGGELAMSWGEAGAYTWAQLRNIDSGEDRVYEVETESVFIQYEWSDL